MCTITVIGLMKMDILVFIKLYGQILLFSGDEGSVLVSLTSKCVCLSI